jgi:hypothetical protein
MSCNKMSVKRGASVLDARPALTHLMGVLSSSATATAEDDIEYNEAPPRVPKYLRDPVLNEMPRYETFPTALGGIEVSETDAWVDRYLTLAAESDFRDEVGQYLQDCELDKSFECEECWEDRGLQLFQDWERSFLISAMCLGAISSSSPMAVIPVVGRPGFMWSLHNGCEEIDNWFVEKRTALECEDAEDILALEWEYGV